jgi:hypothetical protein
MNFALLLSVSAVTVLGLGSVLLVLGLREAPEAFQDEKGFHYGRTDGLVPVESPEFAGCLDEQMAYASR